MSRAASRISRAALQARLSRTFLRGSLEVRLPDGGAFRVGDGGDAAVVEVLDERVVPRVLFGGERAAADAWVNGHWRTDDLPGLLRALLRARPRRRRLLPRPRLANGRARSAANVRAHYDLGNDFFRLFLDETMTYSCALYRGAAETLEDAQRGKHELVCDKLAIDTHDRVLDLGCGWGAFALHAARTRGCRVTAVTLSRAQAALVRERAALAGQADRIDVLCADYRDVRGRFDKVVSIEMFEAVGPRRFGAFFAACARLLRPAGAMLLQAITAPDDRFSALGASDWTERNVFPGVLIPSLPALERAARPSLCLGDVEEIGPHYEPTLREWRRRFLASRAALPRLGFDERFARTWELYLSWSEAAFAERALGDVQLSLRMPR